MMKVASHIENWVKAWCPHCAKPNMIALGDPNDLTGIDIRVVRCASCHVKFALYDEDDSDDDLAADDSEEDA